MTLKRVSPSAQFPLPKAWTDRDLRIYADEYAVFDDAIVTGPGAFIVGDRLFTKDVFYPTEGNSSRSPDNISLFLSEYNPVVKESHVVLSSERAPTVSGGTHFLLMDNNRGNFWHFIHDILSKFYILDAIEGKVVDRPKIIRQKNKLDMQHFLLPQFLKDRPSVVIPRGGLLRVERLVVPARANGITGFSISAMEFVRTKLLKISDELAAAEKTPAEGKLYPTYISRRGARTNQGRDLHNLDELEKLLELYDFRTAQLETMTPVEQILMLRNTSVLLGVHGAGLANQFFLPRSSNVVEITGGPRRGVPQTPDLMTRDSQIFGLGGYVSVPYAIKDKYFIDTKNISEMLEELTGNG